MFSPSKCGERRDRERFVDPNAACFEFVCNAQRPFDDNPWLSGATPRPGARPGPYLLFGTGTHWCPADELALEELTHMALALLRALPGLRLVSPLRYDGPAAGELIVEG